MCNKGITQFHLPPTHEPYLPLLPSRKESSLICLYPLRLPTKGWPGWVDLDGWLRLASEIEPISVLSCNYFVVGAYFFGSHSDVTQNIGNCRILIARSYIMLPVTLPIIKLRDTYTGLSHKARCQPFTRNMYTGYSRLVIIQWGRLQDRLPEFIIIYYFY